MDTWTPTGKKWVSHFFCIRPGRAAHQHLFGASLRPVPWGQHAVAHMKNPASARQSAMERLHLHFGAISEIGTSGPEPLLSHR